MLYKKPTQAYKQAGDGEDDTPAIQQNPLMREIAKLTGENIDKKKFDIYSTLMDKYARKFESFGTMLASSSRFVGDPAKTIDKIYTISASIVEALEDLKKDVDSDQLADILPSILVEWSDSYSRAKMNVSYIERWKNGIAGVKPKDIQKSIEFLKKSLSTLSVSLNAYAGYFSYAQKRDDANKGPVIKQDFTRLNNQLQDELYDLSVIAHMDFQGPKEGLALENQKMQGALLRTADRLVTIVDPYIDPSSPKIVKDNARIYNLLHDISISAEALVKIAGRFNSKEKLQFIVNRDLVKPLTQVVYLLSKA